MRSPLIGAGLALSVLIVRLAWSGVLQGGPGFGRTIEGYPVGDRICEGPKGIRSSSDLECKAMSEAVVQLLRARPAEVVSNETYADGYGIFRTYGTGHTQGVVALKLRDGSTRAMFLLAISATVDGAPPTSTLEPTR